MQIKSSKTFSSDQPHLIVPVFSDQLEKSKILPSSLQKVLDQRVEKKEFLAKENQICEFFSDSSKLPDRIIFLGLGHSDNLESSTVRNAIAIATKKVFKLQHGEVHIFLSKTITSYGQEIGEGVALANYSLGCFQTGKAAKKLQASVIKKFHLYGIEISTEMKNLLSKGVTLGAGVNFVRDLVNGPANIVDENFMIKKLKEVSKMSGAKLKILRNKEMKKLKMGAILGVNQGSAEDAILATLEYNPTKSKKQPVILAGKGVLFDTGGYNLKPTSGIDTMHMDMAGSALVLGVMSLLKVLKIKVHVVGVVAITQNMIDAHAQRTNDIVTSFSGKTIQILNTDAEGRLILADALSYAQKIWKTPAAIIDFATLTGACMVALGHQYAGLFGNSDSLMENIAQAAAETDEGVWPMPIHRDHFEAMKDDMADLRNIDRSRLAGASKGAGFLKHFIEKDNPWAHLDIAGPAFISGKPKDYDCKYGTGFGLRMMIKYLENMQS